MRKALIGIAAGITSFMLLGGSAYAHYCTNASKPAGQGSAGWALLDGDWNLVDTNIRLNKQGRMNGGGFFDLYFDKDGNGRADEGDLVARDLFAHAGLPLKALGAAGCGRGVETPVEFFAQYGVEICPQ